MKKLLIALIVFIHITSQTVKAYNPEEFPLDDFVCNYYETILKQIDFYIDNDLYYEAENEVEKLYYSKCRTKEVAERYLRILYHFKKNAEAYQVAEENELLDTDEGLILQADMNLLDRDSSSSRSVYDNILIKGSYDNFAQLGLTQNYIYIGSPLTALGALVNVPKNQQTNFLKAKAYYNMEMYQEAYEILDNIEQSDEVISLKNQIKKRRAYQFVTGYELYVQKLNEEFKMDANKIAFSNSCYEKNMQVYFDYVMHIYTSGVLPGQGYEPLNNVTNEIRLGTQGRLKEKIALRADFGAKFFQDSGAMLLTDSWIKYYHSDNFNCRLGFSRNNTEQTFLSAVGVNIDNRFTGQVANNNLYINPVFRLPKRAYVVTKIAGGLRDGYNLPNNFYWEGLLGIGKIIRYDETKPYLQKIAIDLVSYNSGYQRNLQKIYDSKGYLYGGYFSPKWYSDDTVNLSFSGQLKKTNLSYGLGVFGGWQFADEPDQSLFIYGASVHTKYNINDYLNCVLQYRYYKYANVTRNQLVFDIVINLYKKVAKK